MTVGVDYWLRKKRLVLFFGGITGERTWVSLIQRRGRDVLFDGQAMY